MLRVEMKGGFSLERARAAQRLLSRRVVTENRVSMPPRYVAGVDVAYAGRFSIGVVAVLDLGSGRVLEVEKSLQETRFPYVPTLLSFREVPPVVSAIRKLKIRPQVFLVDGHGRAHPYRLGFASHLGLVIRAPTIGVAKRILCGRVGEGSSMLWNPILHEGEVVGAEVYTKPGGKPVYVSVGHMVSLETAVKIVLMCVKGHRIPEPILKAHQAASREKERLKNLLT